MTFYGILWHFMAFYDILCHFMTIFNIHFTWFYMRHDSCDIATRHLVFFFTARSFTIENLEIMRYHEIWRDTMRYDGISWDIRDLRVLEISIFLRFFTVSCASTLAEAELAELAEFSCESRRIGILWSFCLHLRDANPWHKFSKNR